MQILNLSVASSFIFFSVLHFSFLSSSYVCYGVQVVKAFIGACLRLHGIYPLSFFFFIYKASSFHITFCRPNGLATSYNSLWDLCPHAQYYYCYTIQAAVLEVAQFLDRFLCSELPKGSPASGRNSLAIIILLFVYASCILSSVLRAAELRALLLKFPPLFSSLASWGVLTKNGKERNDSWSWCSSSTR